MKILILTPGLPHEEMSTTSDKCIPLSQVESQDDVAELVHWLGYYIEYRSHAISIKEK